MKLNYISSVKLFSSVPIPKRHVCTAIHIPENEDVTIRRRKELRKVDRELKMGNYKAALSMLKNLHSHPAGILPHFGVAASKVVGSVSAFDELKLGVEIEAGSMQLIVDNVLDSVKRSLEFQLQEEEEEEETEVLLQDIGNMTNAEDAESESDNSVYEDHLMCMHHEAGHFLVGYILGLLPERYKVPSVEDLSQDRFAVGGKVDFLGFEFLRDVRMQTMSKKNFSTGKLNIETLRKFTCVLLGGLTAEHLSFGYSELLHSDVEKLDRVLKWLGLTQNEANFETRRAAESAVLILCSYNEARCRLAEAMALGRSVGSCIDTIETTSNFKNQML